MQARLWKLEARLEDWRDGLLPSSSLVNRLRELAKWVEEQRPAPPTEAMEAEADPTAAAAETPSTSASPAPSSPTASVDGQDGAAVAAMEEEGEMKAEPAKPEEESAAAASTTSSEAKAKWSAVWDPTHQAYYYYNTETGATTWDTPPSMGQEAAAGNGERARWGRLGRQASSGLRALVMLLGCRCGSGRAAGPALRGEQHPHRVCGR